MIDHLPDSKPKILIVLHQVTSTPGRVGQLLVKMGFELDIKRPPLGDQLPETLADYHGAVMFGGPMSANDDFEYVGREINWLDIPLKENKPFLGICLGAQMLVRHLGKKVYSHPEKLVEIGWYPLETTDAGKELMEWPEMVYQFHREGFELPEGAVHLAGSKDYPNQAFRYGENAWAVQFHAELTLAMMHRWVVKAEERFELPGAQNGPLHLKGRLLYDQELLAWLKVFLQKVFGSAH